MNTAREILEARLETINAELVPLGDELAEARKKCLDIEKRVRAIADEIYAIEKALQSLRASEARPQRISIMDAIMETLEHRSEGMTAREILNELNIKYFDGSLARHSLSPQLSRLKDRDKKLEYRNERWIALADQPSRRSKG